MEQPHSPAELSLKQVRVGKMAFAPHTHLLIAKTPPTFSGSSIRTCLSVYLDVVTGSWLQHLIYTKALHGMSIPTEHHFRSLNRQQTYSVLEHAYSYKYFILGLEASASKQCCDSSQHDT